ncbi:hypothetical protein DV096_13170 [Bradymonadaceae bacterium TMQ3]|nr:hypothetical protein DV096_13170 [Bradymonadaceae bacterium TMQ3]TXC75016.1 hypothetical protein FRC91_13050 [Bradymonadales bacterium TMQ1]
MQETKFDQVMLARLVRARDAIAPLNFNHPVAQASKELCLDLIEAAHVSFIERVDEALEEGGQAARAAAELNRAEVIAEASYMSLFDMCQARYYSLKSSASPRLVEFTEAMESAFGGVTPGRFVGLGLDAASARLRRVVEFCTREFVHDPRVDAARQALGTLLTCRAIADAEQAESTTTMSELQAARTEVRRAYGSARHLLEASLRLVGLEDDLNQLLAPLYTIYRPQRKSAGVTITIDPDEPHAPGTGLGEEVRDEVRDGVRDEVPAS